MNISVLNKDKVGYLLLKKKEVNAQKRFASFLSSLSLKVASTIDIEAYLQFSNFVQ